MGSSTSNPISKDPTPAMLAGVYIEIQTDEDTSIVPCQPPASVSPVEGTASMDRLAGRYLLVEGPEDLTVRAPSAMDLNGR